MLFVSSLAYLVAHPRVPIFSLHHLHPWERHVEVSVDVVSLRAVPCLRHYRAHTVRGFILIDTLALCGQGDGQISEILLDHF